AIECEKLARHEAACRLRGENFRPRRPHGDEQGCDHNRQPRNHTGSPPHYRRRGDRNPPLTIRIRRDFAGCWSTKSEYGYPILTTIRPRTCSSTISRAASMTSARPISFVMAAVRLKLVRQTPPCVRRSATGHMIDSIPNSEALRRINRATEVGKSMLSANPQAAVARHGAHVGERGRADAIDSARSTRFSQGFCGSRELFALDDRARAEACGARPTLRIAPATRARRRIAVAAASRPLRE